MVRQQPPALLLAALLCILWGSPLLAGCSTLTVGVVPATATASPVRPPGRSWPVYRKGANGENVRTIQYLLTNANQPVPVDGSFGDGTEDRVKQFQAVKNVDVDGIVGGQTWELLIVSVRSGNNGPAVQAVQSQLNAHGERLDVDGIFGPATERAVKQFQRLHGLEESGTVGLPTWLALVSDSSP